MTTLRWILGTILALTGGAFVGLSILAGDFRKSFGASAVGPLVTFLPIASMGLLLAALIFPANKILLHAAGAAAGILIGLSLWQMVTEGATILWCALFYLAGWLIFYWHFAWGAART